MDKKAQKFKFKLDMDKNMSSAGDAGTTPLLKKQKIMIRPVINLPQSKVLETLNADEEYDPSEPTIAEDEQDDKSDEAYDPFQPTLSDDNADVSPEVVQASGFDTFSKVGDSRPIKPLPANDLLNDLDIDQMLDSQYNEAIETKKKPKQFGIAQKIKSKLSSKQSSKNDFDIFAEEELEKAHAAAVVPTTKDSDIFEKDQSTETKFDLRTEKIKSAFNSVVDPIQKKSQPLQTNISLKDEVIAANPDIESFEAANIEDDINSDSKFLDSKQNVDLLQNVSSISSGLPVENFSGTPNEKDSHEKSVLSSDLKQSTEIKDSKEKLLSDKESSPSTAEQKPTSPHRKDGLIEKKKPSKSLKKDTKDKHSKSSKRSKSSSSERSQSLVKSSKKQSKEASKSQKTKRSSSRDKHRSRSHSRSSPRKSKKSKKRSSRSRSRKRSRSPSYRSRRSRSKRKDRSRSKSRKTSYERSKKHLSRSRSPRKLEKSRRRSRSRSKKKTSATKSRRSRSKTPEKRRKLSKRSEKSRSKSKSRDSASPPRKKSSKKTSQSDSTSNKAEIEKKAEKDKTTMVAAGESLKTAKTIEQESKKASEKSGAPPISASSLSDTVVDEQQSKKKKKKKKEESLAYNTEATEKKKKKSKKHEKQLSDIETSFQEDAHKSRHKTTRQSGDSDYERKPKKKKKEIITELSPDLSDQEKSSKHHKNKKHKHHKRNKDDDEQKHKTLDHLSPTSERKSSEKKSKRKSADSVKVHDKKSKSDTNVFSKDTKTELESESIKTLIDKKSNLTEPILTHEPEKTKGYYEVDIFESPTVNAAASSTPTKDVGENSEKNVSDALFNQDPSIGFENTIISKDTIKYDPFDMAQNKSRSPSLSPPLFSPFSSPSADVSIQNTSMVMSSQELTETPSYAETFLEQSRKRWAQNYKNKSPHLSSTVTPDYSSTSDLIKSDAKPLLSDNPELSSLSDISLDPNKQTKFYSSENTTTETSINSVEDIFAESNNLDKTKQLFFESAISINSEANSSDPMQPADGSAPGDTDFRRVMQDIKEAQKNSDLPERDVKGNEEPDSNSSKKQNTSDKAKPSRKRSRSPTPSRSSSRHSERKKTDRRKRSRSRSYERRSRHRRSSSRSPRRKRVYASRRSSRDKHRSFEKSKSPDHKRYSKDAKSSHRKPDISLTQDRITKSPKKELLNMFLQQSTEILPLLVEKGIENPVQPEEMFTSPQPIATISGISSSLFHHGTLPEIGAHDTCELADHHDLETNAFKDLVHKSRPALIQIPTIDSHTSDTDKAALVEEQTAPLHADVKSKEPDLYSPSCPMSPSSPPAKTESLPIPPPPPPLKVTSSAEVSSTTPSAAASLFSKLFGIKKDSLPEGLESTLKQEALKDKDSENVLNPTQILSIAGLNPQQQSAAKDAIMSIAELSKHLQLGQILSNVEKKKASPSHQKEADGLSPVNIDDIESSAVALYNNDRQKVQQLKKEFQEKVVAAAKSAIKPHYERREVNKEQYKDIMKRAVNKICQTDKNMEVNDVKVRRLIRRYVECYQQKNEKKKEKMKHMLDQKLKKHTKHKDNESELPESPPSPEDSPFDPPYSPIDDEPVSVPTLLKKEPRKIVTLPDLPLPPPPPPPRPKYMM